MGRVIDHNSPHYRRIRQGLTPSSRYNGAFYYSKEIVANIIPRVKTNRSWVTINTYWPEDVDDGSIVFIHNNLHPEYYEWLKDKQDLILVCGVPETRAKVEHLGKAIYLPLSVDVDYVSQFKREKTKDVAFVGRRSKKTSNLSNSIDYLMNLPRQDLLPRVAEYQKVYGVGRCAIEAKILGCEVLPYDSRYPDPSIWRILDNKDAAIILQKELEKIDG